MNARIYTRTGDTGKTSLYKGKRVSKSAFIIEIKGLIDELNTVLGLSLAFFSSKDKRASKFIETIQEDLFELGAHLSGRKRKSMAIFEKRVTEMENMIDSISGELPELRRFIIPGGSIDASMFHLARITARKVERNYVKFSSREKEVLMYLNRLSDFLFVFARYANKLSRVKDKIWIG